jgi:prepilin-type N-terminal cleavage/methylation domain-containing protein
MKSKSGFTMIELIVTIIVIGILSSITIVAYNKVQQDARDSTRRGNVAIIAEALEKYYSKNGEYPSVRSLANNHVGNTGTVVAAKLSIDVAALKMPQMPASATNGILSAATPINNYVVYIAMSYSNDANCQSLLAGGCDEYTLKYVQESGTTVTVESRRKGAPS